MEDWRVYSEVFTNFCLFAFSMWITWQLVSQKKRKAEQLDRAEQQRARIAQLLADNPASDGLEQDRPIPNMSLIEHVSSDVDEQVPSYSLNRTQS
jgi:hypothetical protein